MRYLLDSNIIIFALKTPDGALASKLEGLPQAEAGICSIVEAELCHGATKYGMPSKRVAVLDAFLAPFLSLAFDSVCVPFYARVRHTRERQGQMIGGNDLMIAAIGLANDLTLITHNVGEFARIPELRVENWA